MNVSEKIFLYQRLFPNGEMTLPIGSIYQIAELSVVAGGEILLHTQKCDEVTYIISGKGKIFSNDDEIEVTAGKVHYVKEGCQHSIIADKNSRLRYMCVGFVPNTENEVYARFSQNTKKIDSFVLDDTENIRTIIELIINEAYTMDARSFTMVNMFLSQVLILLERILFGENEKEKKQNTETSNYAVYHTLRYIDREFLNIKSVKSMAEQLCYSESYLSHLFKERVGISIKQYLQQKKISHAENLLKNSNMTIGEISEITGYDSLHTFYQAFQRINGISPTEYRKRESLICNQLM